MAFAIDRYEASSSQTDFTISFAYLDSDDVYVYQNGTLLTVTTDYTIVSTTTMRLGSGASTGDLVVIRRKTSQTLRLTDYASASTLTEADLDNDSLQAFYMAQEALDAANEIHNAQSGLSVADDGATSVTIPSGSDTGVFEMIVKGSPELAIAITYVALAGGAEVNTVYNVTSASVVATTGALAGTTGTDGKITVAPHTDGKVYIENRSGGTLKFGYSFRNAI